ncbi:MAG: methionyl-tRNA formyltransferase [Planctomycetota bacterium]
MQVIFFGSGEFAVPVLQRLHARGCSIPLVVTQPDRPAGRFPRLHPTPVKESALALGLSLLQPDDPAESGFLARIRSEAPDLCIVAAYGCRLPGELLAVPKRGFINAHASLLPKYRGAAPVPHAIWNGEKETGVTVFRVEEDWDAGPVYAFARTPIRPDDTSGSVLDRLAGLAAGLLAQVASEIETGCATPLPQDHALATRAPRLRRKDGRIDWAEPAEAIERQVRALQPWPIAFTLLARAEAPPCRLQVLGAALEPEGALPSKGEKPGTVLEADPRIGMLVAAGGGALRLTRVKAAGKRALDGAAYVRGARIRRGMLLGAGKPF